VSSDKVNYQINNSRTTSTCLPATGVPIQDKYNGYGIMQITKGIPGGLTGGACQSPLSQPTLYIPTTNTPTQNMIWNWVANINAGEAVMVDKFTQEITYETRMVNQQGAYYLTPQQREMNVWQLYNGGYYYVWKCATPDGTLDGYPCGSKLSKCNANGPNYNSTYSCQWVTNTTLQVKKCSSVDPTYNYAQCVEHWANLNPLWCGK